MEAVLIKYYPAPLIRVIDNKYLSRLVYMVDTKGITRRALRNYVEKKISLGNSVAAQECVYIRDHFDHLLNSAVELGYVYSRRVPRDRPPGMDNVLHHDELIIMVSKM